MKPHSIVAGIDFGPETERIVAYAGCFGGALRSRVNLLYVIDYLLTPPAYLLPYMEEERKRDEDELGRWTAQLGSRGIAAEGSVMTGRLHEAFLKTLQETAPDLLVIGYRSHPFRMSSSERLIKALRVPMLVVRGSRPSVPGVAKILCALDFSDNAGKALRQAAACAEAFSAELHLIHSIPSHSIVQRWDAWNRTGRLDREQFDGEMQAEAETALAAAVREAGLDLKFTVLHGDPAEAICAEAERGGYDLVVMGARGLSYLEGLFIGSTTEAVLRTSPCPLLIIH